MPSSGEDEVDDVGQPRPGDRQSREAARDVAQRGHAVGGQIGGGGDHDGDHDHDQRTGQPRGQAPQHEEGGQGDQTGGQGGDRELVEARQEVDHLADRPVGLDGYPGQLGQLPADQDDRHPVDEAHHRRPREVVRDPAQPHRAGQEEPAADEQGQRRRQLGEQHRVAPRQRGHGSGDQRRGGALGTDDELPRRPEQGVGHDREQEGVEAGDGRKAGDLREAHGRGDRKGGDGQAGDAVPQEAGPLVALELSGHRHGPVQQARAGPGHEG